MMLIRVAPVFVFIALGLFAWRIFVRKSRLEVRSEREHFPTVSGYNLNRQEFEFPRDFTGDSNLLFIPFLQSQQMTVNTWVPFAQELEASHPGVVYYELPTIDERTGLSRTFINEGMRAGIPDEKSRQRTVTLYIDTAKFMAAAGIPSKEEVHIMLVNRNGDILWRTTGDFDNAKGNQLSEVIKGSS